MKKAFFIACLILLSAFLHAQNLPDINIMSRVAERIGLTETETEQLLDIYTRNENGIREAQLELDIYRAQLARLLYPADVDMREVEALLRKSYEWQLKRQLAQIRRQVEIRKLLGEDRWVQYTRFIEDMRKRAADQAAQAQPDQNSASNR